jgi:hypothetical protein
MSVLFVEQTILLSRPIVLISSINSIGDDV